MVLKKALPLGWQREERPGDKASCLCVLSLPPHTFVLAAFLSANKGVHLTDHLKSFLKKTDITIKLKIHMSPLMHYEVESIT